MFEEDPEAYGFRQVGYLAAVPEAQVEDLVAIRAQHERAGLRVGAGRRSRWVPRVPDLELAGLGGAGRGAAARAPRRLGRRDADGAPPRRAGARGRGRDPRGGRGRRLRGRGASADERRPARLRDARAGGGTVGGVARRAGGAGARALVHEGAGGRVRARRARDCRGARAARRRWCTSTRRVPLRSDRDGRVLVDGPWGIYFRMGRTGTGDHGRRAAGDAGRAAARPVRAARQPGARGRGRLRGAA